MWTTPPPRRAPPRGGQAARLAPSPGPPAPRVQVTRGPASSATPSVDWMAASLAVLLPLLLLWPLPVAWPDALLADPRGEAVRHVWAWWAALQSGLPLGGHTELLATPDGAWAPVIDPLHLLIAAGPMALLGPGAGLAVVIWTGHAVSGLAGALLARESGLDGAGQRIGAALGASVPGLLGVAVDGITEGLGAGWVGLQLALLLAAARDPRPRRLVVLGIALVAAVHAGPYNAVWCALLDGVVGLLLLRRTRAHVLPGALAVLLSLPFLLTALGQDADQPGGGLRTAALPPPPADPWRGAWRDGADLLDLFVPAPLTGHAPLPATAYLGLAALLLAAVGAWRWRRSGGRPWPWVAGGLAFALLALGPFLVVAGDVVTIAGHRLALPAGLLERVPPLDRITRWYRGGAVAVLLLAPLVGRALPPRLWPVAALVIVFDARLMAPVPMALPVRPMPNETPLAELVGPLAELPDVHPLGDARHAADDNLALQMVHGQPLGRARDDVAAGAREHPGLASLRRAWRLPAGGDGAALARSGAAGLRSAGFGHLVVYPERLPGVGRANLEAALGPAVADGQGLLVFALSAE